MPTMTYPVRIERIVRLGSHYLELLADGSIDIHNNPENPDEYVHLDKNEAYFLYVSLYEQIKTR